MSTWTRFTDGKRVEYPAISAAEIEWLRRFGERAVEVLDCGEVDAIVEDWAAATAGEKWVEGDELELVSKFRAGVKPEQAAYDVFGHLWDPGEGYS